MSNKKLTLEALEKLVKEVLQEKNLKVDIKPVSPFKIDTTDANSRKKVSKPAIAKNDIESLSGLDGDDDDLSMDDLVSAFRKSDTTKDYRAANKIATKGVGDLKTTAKKIKDAKPGLKTPEEAGSVKKLKDDYYQPMAIASQALANLGSEDGVYPEGLTKAINTMFKKSKTLLERFKKISTFSKRVSSEDTSIFKNNNQKEVIASVMILDYFATIAGEMETGSGAYQFESFLAAICGGKVTGKEDVSTGGTKGKMGAVDFTTNTGGLGSAKFYSAADSSVGQSLNSFNGLKNKPIVYVVAHKKTDTTSSITYKKAHPLSVMTVNVYITCVVPLTDSPTRAHDFLILPYNGSARLGALNTAGKLKVGGKEISKNPIQIEIAFSLNDTTNLALKSKVQDMVDVSEKNAAAALDYFMQSMKYLEESNQKIKSYSVTGNKNDGNAALLAMDNLDVTFLNLIDTFGKGVTGDRQDREITEEKKSKKDLDNLIKEVILKRLLK